MRLPVALAAILSITTFGFAGDQSWEYRVRMAYESWTAGDRAKALALWELVYHDPDNANHPETMASVEFNRATALLWFGRMGEAETGFLRALKRHESIYGQSSPGVASTLHSLALLYLRAGRPEEAKSWSKRALEIQRALYGNHHQSVASSLNVLAEVLMSEGRQQEAVSAQQEAITICEQAACSDWLVGVMLGNLGRMLGASDATRQQAGEFCLRARLILEKTLGVRHPYVALALVNLAELERRNGKSVEAEAMLRSALDIQREAWPKTHPDTAKTLYELGWVIADQRRFSEAASFFEQAAVMREALFGPDSLYMAERGYKTFCVRSVLGEDRRTRCQNQRSWNRH